MPDADDAPIYGPPPPKYAPAPYKAPPPKYAPAPHPVKEHPPQPYAFEYGVADQYSGTNFQAVENQDEKGTVIGKFWNTTNWVTFYFLIGWKNAYIRWLSTQWHITQRKNISTCPFSSSASSPWPCPWIVYLSLQVPTGSTFLTVASKLWPILPTIMGDSWPMSNTKEKLNTLPKRSTSPLPLPNTLPLLNTPLKLTKKESWTKFPPNPPIPPISCESCWSLVSFYP